MNIGDQSTFTRFVMNALKFATSGFTGVMLIWIMLNDQSKDVGGKLVSLSIGLILLCIAIDYFKADW